MKFEMEVDSNGDIYQHSGPGNNYPQTNLYHKGTRVYVYGYKDGWYESSDGWFNAKYLKMIKDRSNESNSTSQEYQGYIVDSTSLSDYETQMINSVYASALDTNHTDIDNIRYLFGAPMQFTALTDPRPDGSKLGRYYLERILGDMSMLTITPGKAEFMKNFSKDATRKLGKSFVGLSRDEESSSIQDILEGKETGRYYSFVSDYAATMPYINNILHMMALLGGIGDKKMYEGAKKYTDFNWQINDLSKQQSTLFSFLSTEKTMSFFIDSKKSSVNDGMSNTTGESILASKMGTGSDIAKEALFLFGKGFQDKSIIDTSKQNYQTAVSKVMNTLTKNSTLAQQTTDRISDHVTTLINGGNIAFPELWKDSQYNKSYDIVIPLVSPYGDFESIYNYIYVPVAHLIGISYPRQLGANGYINPPLIRAFCKGLCNCTMGIIDGITFKKASQEGWSKDGLPTEVEVTLSIRDLYQNLALSKEGDYSTYNNIEYMDMIATWCGVNLNVPEFSRKINIYEMITKRKITQFLPNIIGELNQNIATKISSMLNGGR